MNTQKLSKFSTTSLWHIFRAIYIVSIPGVYVLGLWFAVEMWRSKGMTLLHRIGIVFLYIVCCLIWTAMWTEDPDEGQ